MRCLITSGVSPAAVTTFQEAQAMSTFAAGQAAFLRNWDYAYANATTPATGTLKPGKVGVEPLPTFQGQTDSRLLQHRRLEPVHQPAQQEHRRDLTFIKFLASPAGADHPGASTPRSRPSSRCGARLRSPPQPGAGHRAEDQAGPAARGHAELPAAEHRDLHERERGAGGLDLAVVGDVGRPVAANTALCSAARRPVSRIASAQGRGLHGSPAGPAACRDTTIQRGLAGANPTRHKG